MTAKTGPSRLENRLRLVQEELSSNTNWISLLRSSRQASKKTYMKRLIRRLEGEATILEAIILDIYRILNLESK